MGANSSGASIFAPHPTIPYLFVGLTDSTSTAGIDPITFCLFRGNSGAAPSTDANTYHHGCFALVLDGTGVSVYINSGTYASPSWTNIGALPPGDIALPDTQILVGNASNVAAAVPASGDVSLSDTGTFTVVAGAITGAKMVTKAGYFSVAVKTNGTTPVNVFGTTNGFNGTITSVTSISQDTTASNITLATNAATVAANIIKGTSIGGVAGTAMTATGFTAGGTATVVSSGAGNSIVVATFTVA